MDKVSSIHLTFNFYFGQQDKKRRPFATKKQIKLVRFIEREVKKSGISPTLAEMAAHMGVKSLRSVTQHLEALEARGMIARKVYEQRGVKVINAKIEE